MTAHADVRRPIVLYTCWVALEPCRSTYTSEVAIGDFSTWQGFKAEARRVLFVSMRRHYLSMILAMLIVTSILPIPAQAAGARDSDVTISFSNGPDTGDSIVGTYTLQFSASGSATLTSLTIELFDGNSWSSLTTLTGGSPWTYYWDTTDQDNGTYRLRASGVDSDGENTALFSTENFTISNQVPVITAFTLADVVVGDGSSPSNRAWTKTPANGTLIFNWSANDDDLSYASLANVPGPGSPTNDGPGSLAYTWNWTNGDLQEGKWSPRLSVFDDSGLSASKTLHIGIDRTGPSVGTPSASSTGWVDSNTVSVSGLSSGASDSGGSGIDYYEIKIDDGEWQGFGNSGTATLTLDEGAHTIHARAVDRVGNIGSSTNTTIGVDLTIPVLGGWVVPELNTSRTGAVDVIFLAADELSGVDESSCVIQYGFDSDGVGSTPDITGRWLSMANGLSGTVGLTDWSTKSRQHLMLRATVVDNASNSILSDSAAFQILPGLDLSWNSTAMDIDRILVRPGTSDVSTVFISTQLISNEAYGGTVTVTLQVAPADRTAEVSWTTLETRVLPAGSFSDSEEMLYWNYTVASAGQWDLKVVIDPNDLVDEKDEGDNAHYFVVTGVSTNYLEVVSGFMPTIGLLFLAGLFISWISRRFGGKSVTPPPM